MPTDFNGRIPGHSLTWGGLLREFIFLLWDRRQPKRPSHTLHDRLRLEKGRDGCDGSMSSANDGEGGLRASTGGKSVGRTSGRV